MSGTHQMLAFTEKLAILILTMIKHSTSTGHKNTQYHKVKYQNLFTTNQIASEKTVPVLDSLIGLILL